ncbi:uncharacterized protein LOC144110348 [Amblyomma americanum]
MSPLSRVGAVLVCACSAYIAEHNIINRTMVATCGWFSGHGKSKKTGVSESKVEKAMYDTVKGIPKDAVFRKRTAIPIWSTEAVVLCSSSGKCSGGDSGRKGKGIVATQLESSCYQGNSTYSTLHAMMLGASILTLSRGKNSAATTDTEKTEEDGQALSVCQFCLPMKLRTLLCKCEHFFFLYDTCLLFGKNRNDVVMCMLQCTIMWKIMTLRVCAILCLTACRCHLMKCSCHQGRRSEIDGC